MEPSSRTSILAVSNEERIRRTFTMVATRPAPFTSKFDDLFVDIHFWLFRSFDGGLPILLVSEVIIIGGLAMISRFSCSASPGGALKNDLAVWPIQYVGDSRTPVRIKGR